jgi:isoleucyl-tRNA synthetase
VRPETPVTTMDRYVLARTRNLVEDVTAQLDAYDVPGACETVRVHLDLLTNWYVRTQRDRFWAEDQAAFDTLWTSLETLTRVMAPLAPLLSEEVWRGLTGDRSVHLTDWPTLGDGGADDLALPADDDLVTAVDGVREAVSAALALRKAHGLRVRQPLRDLRVATATPDALAPFTDLLAAELNVKRVTLSTVEEAAAGGVAVRRNLAVNARAAGPRLGRGVQAAIRAAKAGDWDTDAAGAVDNALRAEGYARDVVRAVQDARKAADLVVSDRIRLTLAVPAEHEEAVRTHQDFIATETLATEVVVEPTAAAELAVTVERVSA